MSAKNFNLSLERVRQVLDYNSDTGIFVWKHRDIHKHLLGKVATHKHCYVYLGLCIDGKVYKAHRIAYFYVHGIWPNMIDHINGCKTDNRLCNLRNADQTINQQNLRVARKTSKTNLLGVYSFNGRYKSCIRVNGKSLHLGTFTSKEDAHEAYLQAKRQFHHGCTI